MELNKFVWMLPACAVLAVATALFVSYLRYVVPRPGGILMPVSLVLSLIVVLAPMAGRRWGAGLMAAFASLGILGCLVLMWLGVRAHILFWPLRRDRKGLFLGGVLVPGIGLLSPRRRVFFGPNDEDLARRFGPAYRRLRRDIVTALGLTALGFDGCYGLLVHLLIRFGSEWQA
jgi:hypothetical protein